MKIKRDKNICMVLAVVLSLSILSACNSGGADISSSSSPDSIQEPGSMNASVAVSSLPDEPEKPAEPENTEQQESPVIPDGPPVVYMTSDVSPAGLIAVYEALGREAAGSVAVKINTGEPGAKYFLSPDLIKDFVQTVDGTIVECNTMSGFNGRRSSTAMHYQVAQDHGYTAIAPVLILDEEGDLTIPVTNGTHLTENTIGAHFADFDFHVVLSHFKGKDATGFGGAITNMSMGYSSAKGKELIHDVDKSSSPAFLEAMAEVAKSVADYAGENILYINVMNNLSVNCDCRSNPAASTMADIGILASTDPIALDKACVDLVYAAPDGQDLIRHIESRDSMRVLEHSVEIGFGSLEYELVSIDA